MIPGYLYKNLAMKFLYPHWAGITMGLDFGILCLFSLLHNSLLSFVLEPVEFVRKEERILETAFGKTYSLCLAL